MRNIWRAQVKNLKKDSRIKNVSVKGDTITIETADLTLIDGGDNELPLGSIKFVLDTRTEDWKFPLEKESCYPTREERVLARHPHVYWYLHGEHTMETYSGRGCLGGYYYPARGAVRSRDLEAFAATILDFLEHYSITGIVSATALATTQHPTHGYKWE